MREVCYWIDQIFQLPVTVHRILSYQILICSFQWSQPVTWQVRPCMSWWEWATVSWLERLSDWRVTWLLFRCMKKLVSFLVQFLVTFYKSEFKDLWQRWKQQQAVTSKAWNLGVVKKPDLYKNLRKGTRNYWSYFKQLVLSSELLLPFIFW